MAVPYKVSRPPRGDNPVDWKRWAEEVESTLNIVLARQSDWSGLTNVTPDRVLDADSTSLDELADVLGTLIADLRTRGILG